MNKTKVLAIILNKINNSILWVTYSFAFANVPDWNEKKKKNQQSLWIKEILYCELLIHALNKKNKEVMESKEK